MAKNVKIQLFLEFKDYVKVRVLMNNTKLTTDSQGINYIIRSYFGEKENQDQAVHRLNRVIQNYENKIQNLEFELRNKNKKKEVNKK